MRQHSFGDLIAHAHHGIQRSHRLLEDHADRGTADAAHLRFWHSKQIFAPELNVAVDARLRGKQA